MSHETSPPSVSPSDPTSPSLPPLDTTRFHPGTVVATPAAMDLMREHACSPWSLIQRHLSGDWGDVCAEDAALNNQALVDGSRLLSSYRIAPNVTLWVITDACVDDPSDTPQPHRRPSTCILRPEDY